MSERSPNRQDNRAPVWGIILLFVGIVLLLMTLNVLPWGLWDSLWRFWPAIIIIIGVTILLRHASAWLVAIIVIIILGATLGLAIWQHGQLALPGVRSTAVYSQPLESMKKARVDMDFAAGTLNVLALAGSANLYEAQAETRGNISSMRTDFTRVGDEGRLTLSTSNRQYWPNRGVNWDVKLTPQIPLGLNIKTAASSSRLDLAKLRLTAADLDINASSVTLALPSPAGIMDVSVKANASNVDIKLPDGVAARIQPRASIGAVDVSSRFTQQGNDYVTTNYQTATDRIELVVDVNVGRIDIR